MEFRKEQVTAAGDIVELIAEKFGSNRAIHPGTAISAAARLAGSFMFRSFGFNLTDIKPGTAVLSEQANEKGPALINVMGGSLINMGLHLDNEKINNSSNAQSNVSFPDSLNLIQQEAHDIMTGNTLSFEEMAYACAMATAFIVKECQNELPVESGFNTAIYGFIEGSKTCPPELISPSS